MSKEEILVRIREALSDVEEKDPEKDIPTTWEYGKRTNVDDVIGLFVERVEDYKAVVHRISDVAKIPGLVVDCLKDSGASSLAVPPGLDASWSGEAEAAGIEVLIDDPPLSKSRLNTVSAVLTAAVAGMAETGTIALDHRPDQGRRILSLLPDTHVCVIRSSQVYTDVPEAMTIIAKSVREGQPITWISGPSATSDIELSRVEGVHGPRNLYVIVLE